MVNLILALTHSYSYYLCHSNLYRGAYSGTTHTGFQCPNAVSNQHCHWRTLQNANLDPLAFNNQYRVQVSGIFESTGTTVRFVPNPNEPAAILTNHLGTYELQEVRFHWGSTPAKGSEHRVDSKQFAAEIHFVHLKQGASPSDTAGDTLSVIAVLCKATDTPISGVWDQLSPVPTKHEAKNPISDFVYSDLLPENRDYYHYEGSLTTPLCNETVQWFVLKNTIDIPKEFLAKLRMVESDDSGTLLTFNFRDLQSLNDREVYDFQ